MPESRAVATKEEQKYYPYTGLFKWVRESFWTAGQDSYTRPPAQDPDMFLQLTNVEPVTRGILERRRGYSQFTASTFTSNFMRSYAFRNETLGLRSLVFTAPDTVVAVDETGNTILNPIFTPANNSTSPRMVLSRNYGYFSEGAATDFKKWDGTTNTDNLTNWGIDIKNVATAVFGPNFSGTAAVTGPGFNWINISSATGACNGVSAFVNLISFPPTGSSQTLVTKNFGIAGSGLTGSEITGIQVSITYSRSSRSTNDPFKMTTQLTIDGSGTLGSGVVRSLPGAGALTTITFGGPTDLWGLPLITPAQVQSPNFGLLTIASKANSTQPGQVNLDCVSVTVFVKPQALQLGTPTGSGNISLISGRTYFFAFQNSQTGHVSALSEASASTGPVSAKALIPLSNIQTCLDPQVDTILILATADGNDQTTLFLLGTVPNGTTIFNDTIPDTVLLTQPVFQETDNIGQLHGVANNNPPPLGDLPVKHKGRIYMAQGHSIFFSKSLDDVTTSTGTITSKWEEAWPATNIIDLSEFSETVKSLMSDGETLWIATERNIRRLIGDGPLNFQKPEVQFNETGVLNTESWRVVFAEGQPVGTMWLTPDLRVMESDFNTYRDVGTPIQDVLNGINPAALGNVHAVFYSKQAFDLYLLHIPTGSNTVPDTICVYNLRTKKWCIWQPTDAISTSLFNIDVNGQPQWLFYAPSPGLGFFWDSTTLQDRSNTSGLSAISYPVTMQTSWLDMGDFTWWKVLNLQILTSDDSNLTLAVDGAVTNQEFNTPTVVLPATAVTPSELRSYLQVPLSTAPARHWWLRFTWTSPASTVQNVLTSHNTEVIPYARF